MKFPGTRHMLVALGVLVIAAVAAAPAHARLTPAGGRFTASSTNATFSLGGFFFRCATSTFSGTISADGSSVSGELHFSGAAGGTTCDGPFLPCEVVTADGRPTTVTFRSTSSVAGGSASGTLALDRDFRYTIACGTGGLLRCTLLGPNALGTERWTITGQTLSVDGSYPCLEGGLLAFRATYTILERISVS